MFENLQNIELFPVSATEVVINISVALICSLLTGRLYRFVHKGPGYSVNFVHSLTMLTMITALVIMVVGSSLARAFGLVGTLSIIHFRTAIKDTHDIVYVFFSLSIGLAAGSGFGGDVLLRQFRDKNRSHDFVRALQQIPEIRDINLFFAEEMI